jgi:hypothetical protein
VGVAGVVGTDFYISYLNNMMQLIVFEGAVRFCNLAGVCVVVTGGLMSTIRGNNQAPDAPSPATPGMLADAGAGTETIAVGGATLARSTVHLSPIAKVVLLTAVIVPAIVIPLVATHTSPPNLPGGKVVGVLCNPQTSVCP